MFLRRLTPKCPAGSLGVPHTMGSVPQLHRGGTAHTESRLEWRNPFSGSNNESKRLAR